MAYGTVLKATFQAVIDMVVATTTFTTTNTTGNYLTSWEGVTYPIAMVRPRTDRFEPMPIASGFATEYVDFRITIKSIGTGTKANQDTMIDLVGEVVDKIESDTNLGQISGGSSIIATIQNVSYSLTEDRAVSAIFYYAVLDIRVLLQRML